jgi:hypothetical protein
VLLAALMALAISGCTSSPAEQGERESKAAAVPVFRLHMTKDLRERTKGPEGAVRTVEKPKSLKEEGNGMLAIELTGPQMVDYLQTLDYNAHGGFSARDASLAAAVYNAAATVIDRIESPPAPDGPAPETTVHAAAAATTPSGTVRPSGP